MRVPTQEDFATIESWGHISDPLAAAKDFSEQKFEKREQNNYHKQAWDQYYSYRENAQGEGSQDYYESMKRGINRTKWEYLKRRKAWYIPPIGWGEFAAPGTARILDLGCGDGDVTQRIADFIAGRWQQFDYDGFPLEIIGIDLNKTRVKNARRLTNSPHSKITMSFNTSDAADGLSFADNYFDHVVCTGVIEILNDNLATEIINEITRVAARGIYIEDLFDEFPGGYPREELPDMLADRGFRVREHHKMFQQPFSEEGSTDPLKIWPILIVQALYAEAENPTPPQDQYTED